MNVFECVKENLIGIEICFRRDQQDGVLVKRGIREGIKFEWLNRTLNRNEPPYGWVILSGRTAASNSSAVKYPSFRAASRRLRFSWCALCAISAARS
jgi:hypothetical protein